MFNLDIDDPTIKKLIVEIPKGECLFKQGEKGDTLFILAQGSIGLYQKTLARTRLVGFVGEGEVLGEKALFSTGAYKRSTTALARIDCTAISFTTTSVKLLSAKVPNFSNQILRLVTERLDATNRLVGILQLKQDHEKVVQYLVHFSELYGKQTPKGIEFMISDSELAEILNMDKSTVVGTLEPLLDKKLIKRNGDCLVIADPSTLISFLPKLEEHLAA